MAGLRGLLEDGKKHDHSFTDSDNNCEKQKYKASFQGILDIHKRPTISVGMGPDRLDVNVNFIVDLKNHL